MTSLGVIRLLSAYFLCFVSSVHSQDILGCGGFVKSDVDINYSQVEVKLYTKHGSLKYSTDCAPNNGYYMIPLYDKGDYVLKVEPPTGWSFEPSSVDLHVDGTTDKCSKGEDINFVFTGFAVNGKVISKGSASGPEGVLVSLTKTTSTDTRLQTKTVQGGSYQFDKLLPGKYMVQASHPTWTFEKNNVEVEISNGNGDAGSSIVVLGYDVSGKVFSEGEPIKGVNFILFSQTVSAKSIKGCDTKPVAAFKAPAGKQPLCHVVSGQDGSFSFPQLPAADYSIMPFYKGEHITFDVIPSVLDFTVNHNTVVLEKSFQVAGFSVSGQVKVSAKGAGIDGAKILLNNKELAITKQGGFYHLDNMKTGTYSLTAKADRLEFEAMEVKVTPNTPQLPPLIATKFSVCGKIVIDRVPDSLDQLDTTRQVTLESKGQQTVTLSSDAKGQFCTKVKPGVYSLKPVLSAKEIRAGLKLAPFDKQVTVTDASVDGILFSQFQAKVTGKVACLESCGKMQVILAAVGRTDERKVAQVTSSGTFTYTDIMPGKYRASVSQDEWCWKERSIDFDVQDKDITDLQFEHTGYILSVTLSHEITLNFAQEGKPGNVGSFSVSKGVNRFCLAKPGLYSLSPVSCHQFQQEIFKYDTSAPKVLSLTAVRHLVSGVVTTNELQNDIKVTITSAGDNTEVVLGPLEADGVPPPTQNKDEKKQAPPKGPFSYKFSHMAKTGEQLGMKPSSGVVLFYPAQQLVTVEDGCPVEPVRFQGKKGVFIEGEIQPSLQGVHVSISSDAGTDPLKVISDAKGKYRVGPLHGDQDYSVNAEKEGYVLTPIEGRKGFFKAFKLGQVLAKVSDTVGTPLGGVLLSLSGGSAYRSNNLSHTNGTMTFGNLSPGEYFLRPMMKEYKFTPASQMINVLEGSTVNIDIIGSRVAYSVYGTVSSLNGEPEQVVIIESVGKNNCSDLQEEGKTEQDGSYRIRGLQPYCEYVIQLKGDDVNQHIERVAPKEVIVKPTNADMTGVNMIAFRRLNQMDVSGNVITDVQYLSSLKVRLYREENPDSPIHTASLVNTPFFYLPSLARDGQRYSLRLTSTLGRSTHDFTLPETQFTADTTYKHFTFKFNPKPRPIEQELAQSSVLVLPLTLLVLALAYNYQKLLPMLSQGVIQLRSAVNKQIAQNIPQPQSDNDDIAGIAEEIMGKKKNKARKA
ncbi:unnamed protein product [Owenia fusiformis]|uniref:Nodal modulator 1 n=1 Tax=Owenia fusiformis TaxID=6347 RepID=A0A8J1TVZ3_OWEFU|nr:unnamed protein product [Owenia fusiformis]